MKKKNGFIDGGIIIVLWLVGIAGVISFNEANNPKRTAGERVHSNADTVIFKKKNFQYYDLATGQTIELPSNPMPKPQKKACD